MATQPTPPSPFGPADPAPLAADTPPHFTVTTTPTSAVAQRGMRASRSFWDLFDFRFEKSLTPWIVRLSWALILIVGALWIVATLVGMLWAVLPHIPDSERFATGPQLKTYSPAVGSITGNTPSSGTTSSLSSALRANFWLVGLTGCISLLLGVLWVRVVLESVLVLFNIAATVAQIDQKLSASGSP